MGGSGLLRCALPSAGDLSSWIQSPYNCEISGFVSALHAAAPTASSGTTTDSDTNKNQNQPSPSIGETSVALSRPRAFTWKLGDSTENTKQQA